MTPLPGSSTGSNEHNKNTSHGLPSSSSTTPGPPGPTVTASSSPAAPTPSSSSKPSESKAESTDRKLPFLTRRTSSFTISNPLSTTQRNNRIDEILDTARKRSIALGVEGSPNSAAATEPAGTGLGTGAGTATGMSIFPRASSQHSATALLDGRQSESTDEATSILQRQRTDGTGEASGLGVGGAGVDYQSVGTVRARGGAASSGGRTGERGRTGAAQGEGEEQPKSEKWWMRFKAHELDNKGSVARDHLALERTFLAWLRTSLAFASIGVAITQLFRLNTTINVSGSSSSTSSSSSSPLALSTTTTTTDSDPNATRLRQLGKPLGATFIGISILTLAIGFHRYFDSQHWIMHGKFPASRGSIALVSLVALALMVTSLVVVVAVDPGQFERK